MYISDRVIKSDAFFNSATIEMDAIIHTHNKKKKLNSEKPNSMRLMAVGACLMFIYGKCIRWV